MLPRDPLILPSYLNTLLRDRYVSLAALCDDLEEDVSSLTERMLSFGWRYDEGLNQFTRLS